MTVVRFRQTLKDSQGYGAILGNYRGQEFGRSEVRELQLVKNDWYMSRQSVETLQCYELSSKSTPQGSQPP